MAVFRDRIIGEAADEEIADLCRRIRELGEERMLRRAQEAAAAAKQSVLVRRAFRRAGIPMESPVGLDVDRGMFVEPDQ